MICIIAGICPKPARTWGEPHYCKDKFPHGGPHICRACGMEFWAENVRWMVGANNGWPAGFKVKPGGDA
jgi:hypothetical protein